MSVHLQEHAIHSLEKQRNQRINMGMIVDQQKDSTQHLTYDRRIQEAVESLSLHNLRCPFRSE